MSRVPRVGVGAVGLLVVLSALAADAGLWKLLGISWVAFFAMGLSVPFGVRAAEGQHPRTMVWSYGLASGAMITSALVFLVPSAIDHDPNLGGFGIAFGVFAGFAAHTVGHRLTHHDLPGDHTALELSAHALAAGTIIGLVYGNMPDLDLLLGLAIVSHKGPAGYAAAKRLTLSGKSPWVLLVPAAGIGLAGIPAGLVALPPNPAVNAVVFGFAAGVFLHVAMDFLPRCELGGDVYEMAQLSDDAHSLLDSLRVHAVGSTAVGGLAVFVAWTVLTA